MSLSNMTSHSNTSSHGLACELRSRHHFFPLLETQIRDSLTEAQRAQGLPTFPGILAYLILTGLPEKSQDYEVL